MLEDAQAWAAQGHREQARRLARQSRRLIDTWKDRDAIPPDVLRQLDAIAGNPNSVPVADTVREASGNVTQAALQVPVSRPSALESLSASEGDSDAPPGVRGDAFTQTAAAGPEPGLREQPPQVVILQQGSQRTGVETSADRLGVAWPPPVGLIWPLGCFLAGLLALPMVALPVCLLAARFSGKGGALLRIEIVPPAATLENALPQQAAIPQPAARGTRELSHGVVPGGADGGSPSLPVEDVPPGRTTTAAEVGSQGPYARNTTDDLFSQIVAMNLDVRRAYATLPEGPRYSKRSRTGPSEPDRLLASRRIR